MAYATVMFQNRLAEGSKDPKLGYRVGDVVALHPDDWTPGREDREAFVVVRLPGKMADWEHLLWTEEHPDPKKFGKTVQKRVRYIDLSKLLSTEDQVKIAKSLAPKVRQRAKAYNDLSDAQQALFAAREDRSDKLASVAGIVDQLNSLDSEIEKVRTPIVEADAKVVVKRACVFPANEPKFLLPTETS